MTPGIKSSKIEELEKQHPGAAQALHVNHTAAVGTRQHKTRLRAAWIFGWCLTRAFALSIVCIAIPTIAQTSERPNVVLKDGTVLARARIISVGEGGVVITHSGGISTVPVDAVSTDDLARGKVEIVERENDQDRILTDERALQTARRNSADGAGRVSATEEMLIDNAGIDAEIEVLALIEFGVLASATRAETGPTEIVQRVHRGEKQGTGLDAHRKVPYAWTETNTTRRKVTLENVFFVRMDTKGVTEKKRLKLRIWKVGTHVYRDAARRTQSVSMYTTNRRDFAATFKQKSEAVAPAKVEPAVPTPEEAKKPKPLKF